MAEKLEGLISFTDAQSVSVQEYTPNAGPASVTRATAATDYYWSSGNALLIEIAGALFADVTLGGVYTCTLDDDTGRVTRAASGVTTFSLTWTSTTIRDRLGFTGNLSGAATYTGSKQARFLWLPDVGRTNPLSPNWSSTSYEMGQEEIDRTVTRAPTGAARTIGYTRRFHEHFEWHFITGAKALQGFESLGNESYQLFWRDVLSVGKRFRYHPDRTSDSVLWTWEADDAGNLAVTPSFPQHVHGSGSRWNIKLGRCGKYIV